MHSAYATDEDVQRLDHLQSELQQGPRITASERAPESGIVLAHDLRAGPDRDRWPSFAPQATALGFRSLMSLQLSSTQGHRSALNLYGTGPHAFDETAQVTASLFSVQAAVLLHGAQDANPGGAAVAACDVIGKAEGVLIERFVLSDDEAFRMLMSASRDTDIKLVDVARWVLDDAQRGLETQKRAERETWGDERRRGGASNHPSARDAAEAVTRPATSRDEGL